MIPILTTKDSVIIMNNYIELNKGFSSDIK